MKPNEILKILQENGWKKVTGSNHSITVENETGYRVPISNHPSKDIPTGTLKKIERLTGVKISK